MKGSVKDLVGAIPGAKLLLKGATDYTFETGSDGTYSVTGLPEGEYTIEVLKPGYAAHDWKAAGRDRQNGPRRFSLTVRRPSGDGQCIRRRGRSGLHRPRRPQRIRISGNVQAAKLLHRVVPSYPREAKEARVEGTVRLSAIVGKDGDVVRLTLLMSPSAELARSAMEAVRQWKYQPTLLNGNPVEIETAVDVNYTLTK